MQIHTRLGAVVMTCAGLLLAAACEDVPTAAHQHAGISLPELEASANLSPEVRQAIAKLRQMSAKFHDINKAISDPETPYAFSIGCIDETAIGVDPSVARGMGYHVTRTNKDLINEGTDASTGPGHTADNVAVLEEPEFLVYAPHENDAQLDPEDRIFKARLVGFDYFVPATIVGNDTIPAAPEVFGERFNYEPAFGGWVRHIYLWGHNPEGIFEDFNAATRLCTDLFVAQPLS